MCTCKDVPPLRLSPLAFHALSLKHFLWGRWRQGLGAPQVPHVPQEHGASWPLDVDVVLGPSFSWLDQKAVAPNAT